MDAIILAAGFATRLYPLTENTAKPLLYIHYRPMIEYILEEVEKLPIKTIYIITNERFYADFLSWQPSWKGKIPIKILSDGAMSVENRLGAIGDMAFVIEKEKLENDTLVMAGDNIFTYDIKKFYEFFIRKQADVTVGKEILNKDLLKSMAVATVDENNKIVELVEKPDNPKSNLGVYACYLFRKETLPLVMKYIEGKNNVDAPGFFIEWLHKEQNVFLYKMDGECYDIGTEASFQWANENFRG